MLDSCFGFTADAPFVFEPRKYAPLCVDLAEGFGCHVLFWTRIPVHASVVAKALRGVTRSAILCRTTALTAVRAGWYAKIRAARADERDGYWFYNRLQPMIPPPDCSDFGPRRFGAVR